MAELDFVEVVGRLGIVVGDSPTDSDQTPDIQWADAGEVWFTPLNSVTKVQPTPGVPATLGQAPIKAKINAQGFLSYNSNPSVWLVDLTSTKVNPTIDRGKATHRVEFRNVKSQGLDLAFDSFNGRFAADSVSQTGKCDITLSSPVPVAGGTAVVVGPQGVSIRSVRSDGTSVFYTLSDGVEYYAGPLPKGAKGDAGTPGVGQVNVPTLVKNYCPNPSLTNNATGWYYPSNANGGQPSVVAENGRNWAVSEDGSPVYAPVAPVDLGSYYAASVRIRATPGTEVFVDSTDNTVGLFTEAKTVFVPPSGEMTVTLKSVENKVPNSFLYVSVRANARVLVTEALCFKVPGPNQPNVHPRFFDGDMPGCHWDSAAGNSQSFKNLIDAVDAQKLDMSPEYTLNLAKPFVPELISPYGVTPSSVVIDGEDWTELITTGVENSAGDTFGALESEQGGIQYGMRPGKTYRFTAEIWNVDVDPYESSGFGPRLQPFYKTPDNYFAEYSESVKRGERKVVTCVMKIPANASEGWLRVYNASAVLGRRVRIRNVIVTETSAFHQPFSGRSPGARYLGEFDRSRSVRNAPSVKELHWLDAGHATGKGSPEGVVVAGPGARYVDTNGTNGAWEWQKRSGMGDTGWIVTQGDTGWRNVVSLLDVNNWVPDGPVLLRRSNSRVEFGFSMACKRRLDQSKGWEVLTDGLSPLGFRPFNLAYQADQPVATAEGKYPGYGMFLRYGYGPHMYPNGIGAIEPGVVLRGMHHWDTEDPWPVGSLPGVSKLY